MAQLVDFTGYWVEDASATTPYQDVLAAQGMSFILRQLSKLVTIAFDMKHELEPVDKLVVVDLQNQTDVYLFDGVERIETHPWWGQMHTRNYRDENGNGVTHARDINGKWSSVTIWSLEDEGNTHIQLVTFKSKTVNKELKLVYRKKVKK
ncbi:hypothetical protein SmJEL517_g00718 [Synchytrium microbalum]|uniref:Lipocalin/cytosolic fatty-acid binding domain-containing protein n=1 Tax=Synchytrium microbalum TaxID=1806994 RepID=A0A507CDU5_9FUNG|nr:uncharacterized protein SmJEL517_g00718 [Synchytrium microbalum]TPX37681.1 hypothetical protein SmJEL517_g00718 [Synchytrium microbalum]